MAMEANPAAHTARPNTLRYRPGKTERSGSGRGIARARAGPTPGPRTSTTALSRRRSRRIWAMTSRATPNSSSAMPAAPPEIRYGNWRSTLWSWRIIPYQPPPMAANPATTNSAPSTRVERIFWSGRLTVSLPVGSRSLLGNKEIGGPGVPVSGSPHTHTRRRERAGESAGRGRGGRRTGRRRRGGGVVGGEGVGELVGGTEVGDGDGEDREGVADGDRSPGGCVGRGAGEPWNAARTTRNPPTRSRNTRNATTAATHRPPRGGGGGGGAAASMTSVPGESGASTAVVEPSRIGVAATGSPCMARSRSSRISSAVV